MSFLYEWHCAEGETDFVSILARLDNCLAVILSMTDVCSDEMHTSSLCGIADLLAGICKDFSEMIDDSEAEAAEQMAKKMWGAGKIRLGDQNDGT